MTQNKSALLASLDTFTESYIETALWSSNYDDGEREDRPLDDTFYTDDLTVDCLRTIVRDCQDFQQHRALWEADDNDDRQAGHDFWLTRNGHGAGFWDGDYPVNGDKLTELSKPYGEVYLYPYRKKIHC